MAFTYRGLKKWTLAEEQTIRKITTQYYDKIQERFDENSTLNVEVKKYSKTGKEHKYAISTRLISDNKIVARAKYADFELNKALRKVLKAIQIELESGV